MELTHASGKGAVGLEGEMIDAPMIKQVWRSSPLLSMNDQQILQANKTVQVARAAALEIPDVS